MIEYIIMILAVVDPISIANEAADKGFKWLFLALLACVLFAGLIIVRYLVTRAAADAKVAAEMIAAANAAHANSIAAINTTHAATVNGLITELTTSRERQHARLEGITSQYFQQAEKLAVVIAGNTSESREVRAYIQKLQQIEELRLSQMKHRKDGQ